MITTRRLLVLLAATAAASLSGADAAANWKTHCAKCHGADGRGNTKMGRKLNLNDFTDAVFQSKFTDREAFQAVKSGLSDAKGRIIMKAAEGLSDSEIVALVPHVRGFAKP